MIKIIRVSTQSLNQTQYFSCLRLTLPDDHTGISMMKGLLKERFRNYQISMAFDYDSKSYIGWAVLEFFSNNPHKYIQVFVDEKHRRKGIGKALVNSFQKEFEYFYCMKWDLQSTLFYNSVGLIDPCEDDDANNLEEFDDKE